MTAQHIREMVADADRKTDVEINTEEKGMNKITFTLSKIMAFCLLIAALALDFVNTESAATFMYTVPFICGLVLGKQGIDLIKAKVEK